MLRLETKPVSWLLRGLFGQQFQTPSMCSKLAVHLNQDGHVRKHECS